ncbi:hypothetical protein BJ508DRAFT_313489 [Ascobolus immersus RN42]|uniref:Uncharacterized protein n=1 Tax=Ascobolus immersus RN42 TaxID=1160509 RepID=A0A3N4HIM2_ASCIM|nr:hypothetical protein BJ508DRAFT_313489 [Ascobolus immersus RN42]
MVSTTVVWLGLLLILQLHCTPIVYGQFEGISAPIRNPTLDYQGKDQSVWDLIDAHGNSPEYKAMMHNNGGMIYSEFNDYYVWLRDKRCWPLIATGDLPIFFMTYMLGFWKDSERPECVNYVSFVNAQPRRRYTAMNSGLYQDFLRFSFTFENPARWTGMPDEYRSWRRRMFRNSVDPRECFLAQPFSAWTKEMLFAMFGYLEQDLSVDLTKVDDRPKCEIITWVDGIDPRVVSPASQFRYFPEMFPVSTLALPRDPSGSEL